MTITTALINKLEKSTDKCTIVNKATVKSLIVENGAVVGVKFEKDGQTKDAFGPVIVCTGGYGADFSPNSLL